MTDEDAIRLLQIIMEQKADDSYKSSKYIEALERAIDALNADERRQSA